MIEFDYCGETVKFDNDEIADVIEDAADYMEKHGSCSGHYVNDNGKVCMEGALGQSFDINESKYRSALRSSAIRFIDNVVRDKTHYPSTVSFSDSHTHQQRLDMLRECAKIARRQL